MRENKELKDKLNDHNIYLRQFQEAEQLVKSHMNLNSETKSMHHN